MTFRMPTIAVVVALAYLGMILIGLAVLLGLLWVSVGP